MERNTHLEPTPDAIRPGFVFDRIMGPILVKTGIASVLIVPGRKTGALHEVPLVPIKVDGTRYLLSTLGLSQWARNLRAAGHAGLRRRGRVEQISVIEVNGEEHDKVVAAFRRVSPPPVKKAYDSNPDAAVHPAFRIEPTGGGAA